MAVRKRFGQHFLHDPAVIDRIVDAVSPRAGDHVLEIGPGRAALTLPLLARGAHVHAIEIDRDLAQALRDRPRPADGKLEVIEADALRFDLGSVSSEEHPVRVVANLPYNISTPILFRLLEQKHLVRDFHLMLQKEVVDRMVSGAGEGSYGRLSVMIALHCDATRLFDVGPGAFQPPPKVWSSVVRLTPHDRYAMEPGRRQALETLVTRCFSQRRKTLRNAAGRLTDPATIESAGLDPRARPETLSVADFVALADAIARSDGSLECDPSC